MIDLLGPVGAFILTCAAIAFGVYWFKVEDKKAFKDHPKFKNVPGGIYMVVGLAAIVGIIMLLFAGDASAGPVYKQPVKGELYTVRWAEMFVGIDYDSQSHFCRKPVPEIVDDDKWTSNVGFRLNLVEYEKRYENSRLVFSFNGKYQHHSCAVNQDKPTYDAGGVEATLRYYFK